MSTFYSIAPGVTFTGAVLCPSLVVLPESPPSPPLVGVSPLSLLAELLPLPVELPSLLAGLLSLLEELLEYPARTFR